MTSRTRRLGPTGLVALVLLLWPAVGRPGPPESAQATIERFHAALLEVMKQAEELGYNGRYAKLEPVVAEHFDTPFMASKSVGRHWKTMGEEDHQRLIETFGRFTVANYAGRFDGYGGQEFQTLREEPSLHDTVLVYTQLTDPDEEAIELNYRMRDVGGAWKIIDIYLNGTVSELALRRSEYSSLIKRDGLEALIAALDKKIDEFSTATSPANPS